MNILNRGSLYKVKNAFKSVYQIQSLQAHNQYNRIISTDVPQSKCLRLTDSSNNFNSRIVSNRFYSTDIATAKPTSLLEKFFGLFKSSKSVLSGLSVLVYGRVVDHVNYGEFIQKFQMPNTFNSWFLITEIHVWMLMVRAMAEMERGELIRNGIVEAMWVDAVARSKEMAPESTKLLRMQIEQLSGQFQYAIIAYDEGLTKDDKQLASAIWRRFFEANCDNYEQIELLVKYIRSNVANLDKMSTDEFLRKRNFTWSSLSKLEKETF